MSAPLVSVIIPTRNRLELVLRAIASVQRQTYREVELVVVDDASTDETPTHLSKLGTIRYLRLDTSVGAARARNLGASAASGELLAFLDSDDEWLPSKLEKQVPVLMGSSTLGAVYCRHYHADDETGQVTAIDAPLYRGEIRPHLLAGKCPKSVSLFLLRRSAFESVGGFDPMLPGFQDTDLWVRMSELWQFDAIADHLVVIHEHGGARVTTDVDARRQALDAFLDRWGTAMEKEVGRSGLETFRRRNLAVAHGADVLRQVGSGHRLRAIHSFLRYLAVAKLSNRRQLAGLVIALTFGSRIHTAAKRRFGGPPGTRAQWIGDD